MWFNSLWRGITVCCHGYLSSLVHAWYSARPLPEPILSVRHPGAYLYEILFTVKIFWFKETPFENEVICKYWSFCSDFNTFIHLWPLMKAGSQKVVCDAMLTHWGRDKMAAICQTTFSNAFPWMKMYEFRLKFHWSLFVRVQLTIYQHWFR